MAGDKPTQAPLPLEGNVPAIRPRVPVSESRLRNSARWLGMEISHRRLVEALQSGWLLPRASRGGHLLAVRAFLREPDDDAGFHPIRLRVKLEAAKLPDMDILFPQEGQWEDASRGDTNGAISFWPGALPIFAISEIAVATDEERARLTSLAQSFSNVMLPSKPIVAAPGPCVDPVAFLSKHPPDPGIPSTVDAQQGAMCMAIWAVPRMAPWLNLLVAGLVCDENLQTAADEVDAHWCAFPPWMQDAKQRIPNVGDSQERLWRAAINAFAVASIGTSYRQLAEATAEAAQMSKETADWLESTRRILRAESRIKLDQWQMCPVGIAIQLVLARPEPAKFKTWPRDIPGLPPAIWWSAAILCGLLTGYRNLDQKFRGSAVQQEALSVHAFRTCGGNEKITWPSVSGKPSWVNRGDDFVLLWGARELAQLPAQNRSKWLKVKLDSPEMTLAATRLAKRLEWQCLDRQIAFRKPCRLETDNEDIRYEGDTLMVLRPTALRLPQGAFHSDVAIEETLNIRKFRHLLVVGPGRVSEPPPAVPTISRAANTERVGRTATGIAEIDVATLASGSPIQRDVQNIRGLVYMTDFLSENEENRVLREIDGSPWQEDLYRRVQHYGWRYDYRARQIDPSMHLGAIPQWARRLGHRLVELGLLGEMPDQVIVNEYRGNQGISVHTDARSFADGIATISLLESWEMNFRLGRDRRTLRLERRSALIMHSDARYIWKHEIPKRKYEPNLPGIAPKRLRRVRRVSLTFRKVRQ